MTQPWTPRIKARHDVMNESYFDGCEDCEGHLTPEAARLSTRYSHLRGLIRRIVWDRMVPVLNVEAYTRSGIFGRKLVLHGKTELRATPGTRTAVGTLTFDHYAAVNYIILRRIDGSGRVVKKERILTLHLAAADSIAFTQPIDQTVPA